MNRRRFLTWLTAGTAAAVVAPAALASCGDPWCGSIAGEGIIPHDELRNDPWSNYQEDFSKATREGIGDYADYTNFSQLAIDSSIDEMVSEAAAELGKAHGRSIKSSFKFFQKTQ